MQYIEKPITVTDCRVGPFAVVITDPKHPTDDAYPQVICPNGGYKTKEDALLFIERFANRKIPYMGLHYSIVRMDTETDFIIFCSWED